MEEVRHVFSVYDDDRSGTLDMDEFVHALGMLGEGMWTGVDPVWTFFSLGCWVVRGGGGGARARTCGAELDPMPGALAAKNEQV